MAEARAQWDWVHTSEIVAAVYNTVRNPKKRSKPFSGADFNPFLARKKKPIAKVGIEALQVFIDGTLPPEVLREMDGRPHRN